MVRPSTTQWPQHGVQSASADDLATSKFKRPAQAGRFVVGGWFELGGIKHSGTFFALLHLP